MRSGTDDSGTGFAARPRARDIPRLKMRVVESIFLKRVARPVVGLLELWRAGKPRADRVGEIFEVGHCFAVLVNFGKDSCVRRGEQAFFRGRGQREHRAHRERYEHTAKHNRADSTRIHSFSLALTVVIGNLLEMRSRVSPSRPASAADAHVGSQSRRRVARGAGWHLGQKKLLRPATMMRRIGVLQR